MIYTVNDYFNKYYMKCPFRAVDVFNDSEGERSFFGASAVVLKEMYGDYIVTEFDNRSGLVQVYDNDFMVINKGGSF